MKIKIKIPPAVDRLAMRFDAQEPRKRTMMLLIALLMVAMAWQNFVLLPYENTARVLHKVRGELLKSLPELKDSVAKSTSKKKKIDPALLRNREIQALEKERRELVKKLGKAAGSLIQPAEMLTALKRLLAERSEIKLIRLEASKIQPIQLGSAGSSALVPESPKEDAVIFRHDIELEIEAGFLQTLAFFKEIEGYPWVFYWDEASYEAMNYPITRTTIRLFTLSMGKGLIGG